MATTADDPAVIIYTSGTTGSPKGAVHAHRVLLGHLPGVEMPHGFFPQPGDRFWTPADWAWIGGLFDVLMPSWHFGVPVVAHRARKFEPDIIPNFLAAHGIRNAFFPPTAMKLMRQSGVQVPHDTLRSIGSGGETLGEELIAWGRSAFGLTINEFYGQTECNLIVSNNDRLFPVRPGRWGVAFQATPSRSWTKLAVCYPPERRGLSACVGQIPSCFLVIGKIRTLLPENSGVNSC